MDENQRLQLANMIKANNVEDQTNLIRNLKHSQILRNDVNNMILLKAKYRGDSEKIYAECVNECNFLFTYYTDIFNKIRKDEIDIGILNKFLDVLRRIEDGELDQHEGSFLVGSILKELYVDSALKKAEKLDEIAEKKEEPKKAEVNISWNQYKKMGK
jgi:DNA repair exonuclease SbcCD nuclease subunit